MKAGWLEGERAFPSPPNYVFLLLWGGGPGQRGFVVVRMVQRGGHKISSALSSSPTSPGSLKRVVLWATINGPATSAEAAHALASLAALPALEVLHFDPGHLKMEPSGGGSAAGPAACAAATGTSDTAAGTRAVGGRMGGSGV